MIKFTTQNNATIYINPVQIAAVSEHPIDAKDGTPCTSIWISTYGDSGEVIVRGDVDTVMRQIAGDNPANLGVTHGELYFGSNRA